MEKAVKTRYTCEEAIQFILEPNSDSEMSNFDGDDSDDDEHVSDKIVERINDDFVETDDESKDMPMEYLMEITPKNKTHNYRWRKKPPPEFDITFKGEEFSLPPEGADEMTPLNYFKIFWSDDIINLLVEQTNLYSVQQTGSSINTNKSEMAQFIRIQMLMSIVSLPAYYMYWAVDTKYSRIADICPLIVTKKMRQYIHCNDNSKRNSKENQENKLYKIEPVLNMVRENCTKIEPEVNQSIDKQIIPAKTSHSGIRQYNPKKPKKWGSKIL